MTDQNRKTLRSFYCRDYLWEHFEQMAQELGCSMDYLINESMRLYARNRDDSPDSSGASAVSGAQASGQPAAQQPSSAGSGGGLGVGAGPGGQGRENHRTFQQVPTVGSNNPSQSQQPSPQTGQQRGGGAMSGPQQQSSGPGGPPPPPPRPGGGNQPAGNQPPAGQGGGNWQQSQQQHTGPPQPSGGFNTGGGLAGGPAASGGQPPLYLSFNNNRYVIEQEKYVIGRGSKHTDLTIRDGNISRKHCAIIYRNGSYYIKDLDSTNGVEYRGNRIESKKIEEGDVFYLCDYELRFSMRG